MHRPGYGFGLLLLWTCLLITALPAWSQQAAAENGNTEKPAMTQEKARERVDKLEEPLYTPFVERYVLDELKQIRIDMQNTRAELIEKITDKELTVARQAMSYATDTVTYFFYLIAGATSVLVIVGWNSIRDMRSQLKSLAEKQVTDLIGEYEQRLRLLEDAIQQKSDIITRNQEEIELTNEVHSLWLKASQETSNQNKISIYDQILNLRPDDTEAITYKADAVLELGEPLWAISLCQRALKLDPENGHAYYQLACAYAESGRWEDAIHYLKEALRVADAYRDEASVDNSFVKMRDFAAFRELVFPEDPETAGGDDLV
ncbi:tetratricopeptide repeat protein [Marinobacteraceae bacterium S3BR75-40.1]